MSDNNEASSFATTGSGKSEAEVAFDLLSKLKGQGVWGERNIGSILDMYAECLDAAKGLRAYEGQERVNVPTQNAYAVVTPQPIQQAVPATPPQAPQPPQQAPQMQPQAQPMAQPVHAQQQQLQQAYKQG